MMWFTANLRRRAAALAVLTAAGAGLSACSLPPKVSCDFTGFYGSQHNPVPEPKLVPMTPGTMRDVPLNTVSVIGGGIDRKVLPQQVWATRNAASNAEVGTRLMNCTDYPLQVQGRTHFLTAEQRPAEPPSAWQRLYLPPRSFGNYGEVAVSGAKTDTFYIEVQEAP